MMKKLLVTLMVLGLISTANAALSINIGDTPVGEVYPGDVISVVSDDTSSWLGYIIAVDGGAVSLADGAMLAAAGDLGAISEYSEAGWGAGYELVVAASPTGTPVAAGAQFTMSVVGGNQGDLIDLYVDPDYENVVARVTVVPEPVTLMLLGLGGLFLRRRR
jgi:hypothetical protein